MASVVKEIVTRARPSQACGTQSAASARRTCPRPRLRRRYAPPAGRPNRDLRQRNGPTRADRRARRRGAAARSGPPRAAARRITTPRSRSTTTPAGARIVWTADFLPDLLCGLTSPPAMAAGMAAMQTALDRLAPAAAPAPAKIVRLWRGVAKPEDADAYEAMLKPEPLPGIGRAPGYQGSYLLKRSVGDEIEFITILLWEVHRPRFAPSLEPTTRRPSCRKRAVATSSAMTPARRTTKSWRHTRCRAAERKRRTFRFRAIVEARRAPPEERKFRRMAAYPPALTTPPVEPTRVDPRLLEILVCPLTRATPS